MQYFGIVALFVGLTLQLHVEKVNSHGHHDHNHMHSEEAHHNETNFILTGNSKSLEPFPGIPEDRKRNLKSLELKYIKIEISDFVQALEGCTNLESITLTYVELTGGFAVGGKIVNLPHLVNYTYSSASFIALNSLEDLRALIFFNKGSYVEISQISSLGVNIKISSQYSLLFEINHGRKEIKFASVPFADEILAGCCGGAGVNGNYNLKSLDIEYSGVSAGAIPGSLTSLRILSTQMNDSDVAAIISRTRSLENLDLSFYYLRKLNVDISSLPAGTLRTLALKSAVLTQEASRDVLFPKLTSVTIDRCELSDGFLSRVENTFGSVKSLQIVGEGIEGDERNALSYKALKKILALPSLQAFSLTGVRRGQPNDNPKDIEEVEMLLEDVGVKLVDSSMIHLVKNKRNRWIVRPAAELGTNGCSVRHDVFKILSMTILLLATKTIL